MNSLSVLSVFVFFLNFSRYRVEFENSVLLSSDVKHAFIRLRCDHCIERMKINVSQWWHHAIDILGSNSFNMISALLFRPKEPFLFIYFSILHIVSKVPSSHLLSIPCQLCIPVLQILCIFSVMFLFSYYRH